MMDPDKPDNRPLRRVPDPDNRLLQRVRALPGEIEHAFANLTETNPCDNPRWTFWQAVAWAHFRRREDINEFSFHPFRARAYARAALAQLRAAIAEGRVVAFDTDGHQLHPMASLGRNPAVFLQSAEILRCFPEDRTKPMAKAKRRGAKPRYDWPDAEDFAYKLLEQRGEFKEWDTASKWQTQADLERELCEYITKHDGREPSESELRKHVSAVVGRWRKDQADKGR